MNKFSSATAITLLLGMVLGLLLSGGNHVGAAPNVVNSFNTRSGNVTLTSTDVTSALAFTPANQADLTATNTNLANNYYTKSASDSVFAPSGSSYTKAESDAQYAPNGAVVKSLNGLAGDVALVAGSNITITPSGNTLTIASAAPPVPPKPYVNPQRVATLQWYEANQTGLSFPVGLGPSGVAFDGANIWVVNSNGKSVTKLRANDGANLGTFIIGSTPSLESIAFDGANIWVTDNGNRVIKLRASDGAILGTFSSGALPRGIAFDGANMWVVNEDDSTVSKLRASDGVILGTYTVGHFPRSVAFDGVNIWVTSSNQLQSITKLRASDGANLGTINLIGGGAYNLAFDGSNMWVAAGVGVVKIRVNDGAILGIFGVAGADFGRAGMAFDGSNMWLASDIGNTVVRIRVSDGAILSTYNLAGTPTAVAFDGANIWVALIDQNAVAKL